MAKQKYTEKKKASNQKWDQANLKRMSLAMPIKLYEIFDKYCTDNGTSKNGMINQIIAEKVGYKEEQRKEKYLNIQTKDSKKVFD